MVQSQPQYADEPMLEPSSPDDDDDEDEEMDDSESDAEGPNVSAGGPGEERI